MGKWGEIARVVTPFIFGRGQSLFLNKFLNQGAVFLMQHLYLGVFSIRFGDEVVPDSKTHRLKPRAQTRAGSAPRAGKVR